MFTATAETPHGTFVKKSTRHEYAVVVVWHRAEQTFPGGWRKSAVAGAPDYYVEQRTYPAATWATWHRVGSKIPTSNRGATRLGVYPVVSTAR